MAWAWWTTMSCMKRTSASRGAAVLDGRAADPDSEALGSPGLPGRSTGAVGDVAVDAGEEVSSVQPERARTTTVPSAATVVAAGPAARRPGWERRRVRTPAP
ncbi:hypothetical protein GCM10025782_02600 [Pedococcus ginsenosidimutans]|uniref:Uncharacterized protein n=1 Tax=Pedococcus ginsenosidimutans TaxID=490570 RepID=A0ABP8XNR3_9MICO